MVLFVGRFVAAKNFFLWVEVAERIAAAVPEARFLMVGDGPLRDAVAARVAKSGIADRFELPGAVPHDRLGTAYAASDVFLLTSNHEGFGRVLAEAFLARVPVVSTACAGPHDIVIDGENGFLCPVGDRDVLAECVVRPLRDRDMARSFARRGRERLRREFDERRLVAEMAACWVRLAGGRAEPECGT